MAIVPGEAERVNVEYRSDGFSVEFGEVESLTFDDGTTSVYLGKDTQGLRSIEVPEDPKKPIKGGLRSIEVPENNVFLRLSSEKETEVVLKGPTHIAELEVNGTKGIIKNGKKEKEIRFGNGNVNVTYLNFMSISSENETRDCSDGSCFAGKQLEDG